MVRLKHFTINSARQEEIIAVSSKHLIPGRIYRFFLLFCPSILYPTCRPLAVRRFRLRWDAFRADKKNIIAEN